MLNQQMASPSFQLSRRSVVQSIATAVVGSAAGTLPTLRSALASPPARAEAIRVAEQLVRVTGNPAAAVLMNGSLPGPTLRFREGDEVEISVTNTLKEDTSIHWHGLIVPPAMDGVPGISFPGIKPGETFTYRFTLRQSGTYWFHSHSGGQELQGHFGAFLIEPAAGERIRADRDYVVMLSDWSDEAPLNILGNLKRISGYYNRNKRTVPDFFRELSQAGDLERRGAILQEWQAWADMRMDPTDLADVSGYTFLMNGKTPSDNWTALFRPGERVRLRFINAAGMSFFDVKIPGLPLSIVQADGQDVEPVEVAEFRIAPGETYDILVEPVAGRAYTIFAQSLDRAGYARGTLAEHPGAMAEIPPLDPRPRRALADMGGGHAGHAAEGGSAPAGGEHAGHGALATNPGPAASSHVGHDGAAEADARAGRGVMPADTNGHATHGAMPPDMSAHGGNDGGGANPHAGHGTAAASPHAGHGSPPAAAVLRKLTYADLRSLVRGKDGRAPTREIVLRLTGDMERYIWTLNGKKMSQSDRIQIARGERVRLTYTNETMMEHPMHLHGMFVELQNGQGEFSPRKHTVIVGPGETVSTEFTADEPGTWVLHCHLLLHMVAGMMVAVTVGDAVATHI